MIQQLLTNALLFSPAGLNIIQPLLGYVQANVAVPDLEICRPIKHIVMDVCMKDAWRKVRQYVKCV